MLNQIENLSGYEWSDEFADSFKGKRVLVTGATGFVGSYLCEALVSLGADVVGVALEAKLSRMTNGVRLSNIDLSSTDAAQKMILETQPDVVYHLAALVNTNQDINFILPTLQNNVVGSINLMLSLAGQNCQRLIITTSAETPHPGCPPNSPYAASKLAVAAYADMFHQLYGLPIVQARPHLSFGPQQLTKKLVPYIISSILNETPILLSSGSRILDMVYIKDLVRGLLLMGIKDHLLGCTFDIGSGNGITIYDIVQKIQTIMTSNCHPIFNALPDRIDDFPQIANIQKAQSLLNWCPLWSLEEGLQETIVWYRKNMYLPNHNNNVQFNQEAKL